MSNSFQRLGSTSNAHVGKDFENKAKEYFSSQGIILKSNFPIPIGFDDREKKVHVFDLGNEEKKIIVECKSYKWTEGKKVPSAKITTLDQTMFYFSLVPMNYRKILFTLRDCLDDETLTEYYVRLKKHLIPKGVKIMEYDPERGSVREIPIDVES